MDQCDTKIDLVKYVGQWPIFHGPLILPNIIVIDKLFLYIKTWHWSGVFMPLRALALAGGYSCSWQREISTVLAVLSSCNKFIIIINVFISSYYDCKKSLAVWNVSDCH